MENEFVKTLNELDISRKQFERYSCYSENATYRLCSGNMSISKRLRRTFHYMRYIKKHNPKDWRKIISGGG